MIGKYGEKSCGAASDWLVPEWFLKCTLALALGDQGHIAVSKSSQYHMKEKYLIEFYFHTLTLMRTHSVLCEFVAGKFLSPYRHTAARTLGHSFRSALKKIGDARGHRSTNTQDRDVVAKMIDVVQDLRIASSTAIQNSGYTQGLRSAFAQHPRRS